MSALQDRTFRTLALAAALIGALRVALPPSPEFYVNSGVDEARFWVKKARWTGGFDVVLAGDSRVFRGLSPEIMSGALPGARIGNFGFAGVSFTPDYLAAVEALIEPLGPGRTVVLGVTPHTLTAHAALQNEFLSERRRPPGEARSRMYFSPVSTFFRPVGFDEILGWFGARTLATPERYFQEFHADGWVASHREPEKPDRSLKDYRVTLRAVQPQIEGELLSAVRRWRAAGVRVFAFRPPASAAMVKLEYELSGFEEAAFVARVEEAGATWLPVDRALYHTYDGSHLREDSARALSADLARRIAASNP